MHHYFWHKIIYEHQTQETVAQNFMFFLCQTPSDLYTQSLNRKRRVFCTCKCYRYQCQDKISPLTFCSLHFLQLYKKEHLSPGVEGGPFILDSASTNFFISSLHQVYQFKKGNNARCHNNNKLIKIAQNMMLRKTKISSYHIHLKTWLYPNFEV